MSKEFDNILDECLERLLVKGETIEQCLNSYPEQADELKPLLQTALATKEATAIQPRAEFKAKARYQFRSALQEAVSPKSRFFLGWLPRWATAMIIVALVVLAGRGTVAAASYSMPDSPLYPVKLASEQVQLMLTTSDLGKADLCTKLADRRVAEIIYMADKGDARRVEAITQRLDKQLATLATLAETEEIALVPEVMAPAPSDEFGPSEEAGSSKDAQDTENRRAKLRITVANYASNNHDALRTALEEAPESTKSALRHAIYVSVTGYQQTLRALD